MPFFKHRLHSPQYQPRLFDFPLTQFPLRAESSATRLTSSQSWPPAVSPLGVSENFSIEAPISLYGATKLASERLAQEYAAGFKVPDLDQSLRCACGGRTVWHCRTRNLLLLVACPLRAVPVEIHWLWRQRLSSSGRIPSSRFGANGRCAVANEWVRPADQRVGRAGEFSCPWRN